MFIILYLYSKRTSSDCVSACSSQDEVAHIDKLAEEIGVIQELRHSYQPILNVILLALDAQAVFMRTKALRALGQIVTSDPTILSSVGSVWIFIVFVSHPSFEQPNVRRGIESHLLDNSPAVRDAAVELIGKYMIDSPEVAADYYQKIADRIAVCFFVMCSLVCLTCYPLGYGSWCAQTSHQTSEIFLQRHR